MPVDQYRMTIQAKPLATLGGKQESGTESVLLGISRPLGHLRKTQAVANAILDIPKPEQSEELFPQIHGVGLYDSEDEMSSKGSAISRDTINSKNSRQRRGSLPSVGMSKKQLFEHRYKLAAARSQPDATKPANMYSKRVVYLPMFRVNVETYIGETEDHKAVETTRQSLKRMLDQSRSKMKSPDKIANKLRDYFKQQEVENIKKQENEKENELSRKEMLKVNIPKTPFPVDSNIIKIPTVPVDGRIHGPYSKVENLDLTSITDEETCSVLSSKTTKTKQSGNESPRFHSERGTPTSNIKQYFGPFIYGMESQTEREAPTNYATYSDIRRMRQKGRLKVVTSKREGSPKTTRSTNDQQDAKDWITIQTKPVLKYTTPQPAKARLDPIVVPSAGCAECPMCKAALYKSTEPTAVPPNSPTIKKGIATGIHEVPDVLENPGIQQVQISLIGNHHSHETAPGNTHVMSGNTHHGPGNTHVGPGNTHVGPGNTHLGPGNTHAIPSNTVTPGNAHVIPTHENFSRKIGHKGPEVHVKKATLHGEVLPVSKVSVKISSTKVGHIKNAKLTKSNSSSNKSIDEI